MRAYIAERAGVGDNFHGLPRERVVVASATLRFSWVTVVTVVGKITNPQ